MQKMWLLRMKFNNGDEVELECDSFEECVAKMEDVMRPMVLETEKPGGPSFTGGIYMLAAGATGTSVPDGKHEVRTEIRSA